MCLPWFEGSDRRCALCASLASCFTIREGGIIQETIDFKVEGLVEDVWRHLCEFVYEWDIIREATRVCCHCSVFLNAGEMRRIDGCSIYTFFKGGLHIEHRWTRNATRNLCHVRDSSTLFE